MRRRGLRHDESGQILPLFVIFLAAVLFGITALVLDVGHAMVVKRHLQASVDAAALAGAEQLPDGTSATSAAQTYGPDSSVGALNSVPGATAAAIAIGCLTSDETCVATRPDAVAVTASASVPTSFARVLGIDSIDVHASSTAARTQVTKPLDVALVIDHTGSMQGEMTDLQAGVASFLSHLDPKYDRVALIVLPPVVKRTTPWGTQCSLIGSSNDPYPPDSDDSYVLDHLTADFAALNADVRCLSAAGTTSYKRALVAARAELDQNGREGVQQAIIFETDGAANTVPDSTYDNLTTGGDGFPTGTARAGSGPGGGSYTDDIDRPCGSAVDYARAIADTTPVYTVGYKTEQGGTDTTCYEAPHLASAGDTSCRDSGGTQHTAVCYSQVRESVSATTALQEIAEEPDRFFDQEDGSKLDETFAKVASQFASPTLIPDTSYKAAPGA